MEIKDDLSSFILNDFVGTTHLPIVLGIDISPSMNENQRIAFVNATLKAFVNRIWNDPDVRVRNSCEVSVVTFSTEVKQVPGDDEFVTIEELEQALPFVPVVDGGSNISGCVQQSYELLERHARKLKEMNHDSYIPCFILLTDGDPHHTYDKGLEQAVQSVQKHCLKGEQLIAPFIIGIGRDARMEALDRMASRFTGRAFHIEDDTANMAASFDGIFNLISHSIRNSVRGNSDLGSLYEKLSKDATRVASGEKLHRPVLRQAAPAKPNMGSRINHKLL